MNYTLLVSSSTELQTLHRISQPNKKEYCDRWKYTFVDHRFEAPKTPISAWCFYRPHLWTSELTKLNEGDYLWFLGVDTLIMNETLSLDHLVSGGEDIIAGMDVNGLNSDSLLFRYTKSTMRVLERTLELKGDQPTEQNALFIALSEKLCNVKLLPQRYLNSYLYQYYRAYHPDPKGGEFQLGDFVLHTPGLPVETKINIFKEYLPKVIK